MLYHRLEVDVLRLEILEKLLVVAAPSVRDDLSDLLRATDRPLQLPGELLVGCCSAELAADRVLRTHIVLSGLDEHPTLVDNPFLVSKSAVHARSHPFTGERLEVVTITGRKLIYRLQQADRAFLEQICNAEAPVGAFPGGNHHPVEVRAGERIPCLGVAETRRLQETPELCRRRMVGAAGRLSKVLHKSFVGPLLAGIRLW